MNALLEGKLGESLDNKQKELTLYLLEREKKQATREAEGGHWSEQAAGLLQTMDLEETADPMQFLQGKLPLEGREEMARKLFRRELRRRSQVLVVVNDVCSLFIILQR